MAGFAPSASAATTTFQRGVSPSSSYTTMYDGEVSSSASSTAKSNPQVVYINYPLGTKVLTYFDVSTIPSTATVTAATLSYNVYNGANLQASVGVFRVSTNWLGGTKWSKSGGDWRDKNNASQGTVPFASVTISGNVVYNWDVTSLVQTWVNGTNPNYGVFLIVAGSTTNWGQAYASGHGTASVHPTLTVTYTTGSSDTTAPVGTLSINNGAAFTASTSVTLQPSATDNSGTVSQMQFSNDGTTYSAAEAYSTANKAWTLTTGDGLKTVSAKYKDAAGNWSQPATAQITLDTAKPTISSVASSAVTASGATITWTTNEASTSQVEYGTTTSYGTLTTLDATRVTSHSVTLSGLSASTLYHYRVRSKDGAGNEQLSADTTFTTSSAVAGGKALSLDGIDDYATAAAPAALKPSTTVAVEAWVKTSATDTYGGEIVSMGDSYALRVDQSGNAMFFVYVGGSTWKIATTSGVNLKNGVWHHVVGQKTATALEVYVDGALKLTVAHTGTIPYTLGSNVTVGRHGNGGTNMDFNGLIDEARVYNRPLTAAEVTAHYNGGAGQPGSAESGLVAGWHFDEGAGTTTADYSGTGVTLTLQNGATWGTGVVASGGPAITTVAVTPTRKPYIDQSITLTVTATGPRPIEYQFVLDGVVVRPWSSSASYTWPSPASSLGLRNFEAQVRDAVSLPVTKPIAVQVLHKPVGVPQ